MSQIIDYIIITGIQLLKEEHELCRWHKPDRRNKEYANYAAREFAKRLRTTITILKTYKEGGTLFKEETFQP